jgi:dipeptidyl aminopeptidase/acylaminoacyl peptidase
MIRLYLVFTLLFLAFPFTPARAQHPVFSYMDVFELQYVSDPQISPDGNTVVYRRMGFDILKDKSVGNLWMIRTDGSAHQKLTTRETNESGHSWSPAGDRLAFVSQTDEGSELYMYWAGSGKVARLSQLPENPQSLTWSPDGKLLAFSMHVDKKPPVLAKMPEKPKNAQWAEAPRITDRVYHEADGRGYLPPGFDHLFVLPADGGPARQITSGDFHHNGKLAWSADSQTLYVSANRNEDWEYDFRNSEIHAVNIATGIITALTDRPGPDTSPAVSPDGKQIAYLGFDDKVQTYQIDRLYLMDSAGNNQREIQLTVDRSLSDIRWDEKGNGLYASYDDKGNTKIVHITLNGEIKNLADNLGGTTIGRPYAGGSYSVSGEGHIAYTQSRPEYPAELAILDPKSKQPRKVTALNDALLRYRTLGKVEEIWYRSGFDNREVQGWLVYPPEYDSSKAYPFLVENHGGPISNYGDRFSAEMQLYAAAGYIVFYPNPRGSTGYGEEFGNLLYHNYPGEDYNDVMDGVDYCIQKGIAHEDQLFVTGGSAGGIMTAWIVGKNNRFEAAVVVKPVVTWISKTLMAVNNFLKANSRFPGHPWENFED